MLAALAKGLVKREAKVMGVNRAKAVGRKMLGDRRKKVGARREAAQKMMGQESGDTAQESGAPVQGGNPLGTLPVSGITNAIQQTPAAGGVEAGGTETLEGTLIKIKSSVVDVNTLLKGSYVLQKQQLENQRQAAQKAERKGDEADLEKGKKKGPGVGKLVPKQVKSFWQGLLDFFTGVILGWVAVRMIKFLPALKKFLPLIAGAIDFITDASLWIVNALGSLVEWGYNLVAMGEKAIGNLFGEEGAEKFGIFMKNAKNLFAGFLVWKIIGQKIFEGILRNIKFVWAIVKNSFKIVGKFLNFVTRGAAGRLAEAGIKSLTTVGGNILSKAGGLLGSGGSAVGGIASKIFGPAINAITPVMQVVGPKVSNFVKGIPVMGPIIVAIVSLMSGEPVGQALFKGIGAALGGGIAAAITGAATFFTAGVGAFLAPVLMIVGETMGAFVGDVLYEAILGGGPDAAVQKLVDTFKKALDIGKSVMEWIVGGGLLNFLQTVGGGLMKFVKFMVLPNGLLWTIIKGGANLIGPILKWIFGGGLWNLLTGIGGGLLNLAHWLLIKDGGVLWKLIKALGGIGGFIGQWFAKGVKNFITDFPTIPIPDIRPGDLIGNVIEKIPGGTKFLGAEVPGWVPFIGGWSVIKALRGLPGVQEVLGFIAQFIPGLNNYVEGGKLLEIPNLALLAFPPLLLPHAFSSFFSGGEKAPSPPKIKVPVPKPVTAKSVKEKQDEIDKQKAKEEWDKRKKMISDAWEGAKNIGTNLLEGVQGFFGGGKKEDIVKEEVIVSSHSHLIKGPVQKLVEGSRPVITEDMTIKQQMVVQKKQKLWDMGERVRGPSIVKPSKSIEKTKSLESYASYEEGEDNIVFVQIPVPMQVPTASPEGGSISAPPAAKASRRKSSPLYRGDG